ncbi:Type I restriction-modification system, DNA methylase subunit [Microbispora rosea]|uniref:Type I restriction-modification system, DNA methylase subunit n=1 Tax=Microbispora rosea TaxID=58117 RepID=A0A1N7GE38_9ACTN|nr:N-6 DNA methylase [Microbispora rosea]GIH50621.1 type II restriction endonuclease subunit M [Microbispora rosea subsp. rosea]SIS10772.1 Type I restriction-modification system, DNA methylase subunit [Microbispora rosea]
MAGDEATVTAADIARMVGVGRAAVSNWRKRYEDFPAPVGGTATSPTFSLKAVEEWLLHQGKVEEVPLRERAWQQIRNAADDLHLGAVVAEATELLLGQGKRRLVAAPAWRLLQELAEEQGSAEVARFLLDRYADVHSRRLFETPPEIAEFMARLAGPDVRSVLDPACGLGTLLTTIRHLDHAYGQEADDTVARLARTRLALAQIEGSVGTGDSLRCDSWPDLTVDAVLCHPPFNERNWGYDDLASDPRWAYGLPPKAESELAWVQHALAHLKPGGIAVLLMPAVAANRRSGRRIRSNLLRQGTVQAVIGLPSRMGVGTGLPLHLWVLRRPADGDPVPSHVLMAEAEPETFDEIADRWQEFRSAPGQRTDQAGPACAVPIIELMDENVDLTPGRHVSVEDQASAQQFPAVREQLLQRLERLTTMVPEAVPAPAKTMPSVDLAEVERAGAIKVFSSGRFDISGSGDLVITDQDLFSGSTPQSRTQPDDRVITEPGDVVVAARAGEFAVRVVTEKGIVLGPRLTLLRPDLQRIDAYFLAGFLRTTSTGPGSGSQSSISRFDPRRVLVPRMPIEEQRRYGEAFRKVFEFEDELRNLDIAGRVTAAAIVKGFGTGELSPPPG